MADHRTQDVDGPGPSKKHKWECKYQQEWGASSMTVSRKGSTFAHCTLCITDISIAHGGVNDAKKHLTTSKHQEVVRASGCQRNLETFFQFPENVMEDAVTRSEILFANLVAEHNLPFMRADHYTHLTSAMFPDSKIAHAFSSARTKATCIVKGALFPHFTEPVFEMCRKSPFSILCD